MTLHRTDPLVREIDGVLASSGLVLRGAIAVEEKDRGVFPLGSARSVALIGNAGGAFWPVFEAWRAQQSPDLVNPLDSWSRVVIDAVANAVGARAVYPSDRPYAPFQQWAMRAEGLKASPLGILMHPEFGVWHAYRGALLIDRPVEWIAPQPQIHLCDLCIGKPCMKRCPAGAHASKGFDYSACLEHVRGGAGGTCRDDGCLDRNACPYGCDYRYPRRMQAFIMKAFMR